MAFYGMVAFGFGEMSGGLFIGRLIDKFGSKSGSIANCVIIALQTGVIIYSVYKQQFNWSSFLFCYLWGMQDGFLNTHCLQILGFEFKNDVKSESEPFAVYNLV